MEQTPEQLDDLSKQANALERAILKAIINHAPVPPPIICLSTLSTLFQSCAQFSRLDRYEFAYVCNALIENYQEQAVHTEGEESWKNMPDL
jgi:hypothetical protein